MSWQQFKAIGHNLHAELAAEHKPSHVRAILKVLQGEMLKEETKTGGASVPASLDLPATILNLLRGEDPRAARKILAIVDAQLTKRDMGAEAAKVETIYRTLRKEFEPKPLGIILDAATRASQTAQRRRGKQL